MGSFVLLLSLVVAVLADMEPNNPEVNDGASAPKEKPVEVLPVLLWEVSNEAESLPTALIRMRSDAGVKLSSYLSI